MEEMKTRMERGTFYQLRNAINHSNVRKSCQCDVNACEGKCRDNAGPL